MDSLDSAPQPMLPMSLGLSLSEPLASLIRIQEPHTPMAPTSLGTPNLCGGAELVVPPFSACLPSWQQAPVPAASTRSVAHGLMPLVSLSPEGSQGEGCERQSQTLPTISLGQSDIRVQAVEIVCGPVSGVFLVDPPSVLLKENGSLTRRISPTEMERLGGKESNKKWKSTLRVLDSKGQVGKPIGDWLRSQGIELKTAQRKSRNKAKRNRAAATSCSGLGQAGLANGTNREAGQEEDEGRARMEMDAHLRSCHLGYRPSDPDCAELPDKLKPFDSKPGTREINLGMLSYEQLLILSRANSCPGGSPASTLLANPPGILADREAYVSGHEPRRRYAPREHAESLALMGEYLSGQRSEPPVEAFGADRAPKLGDKEVNLRQLYALVRFSGGFDQVNGSRKWPGISDEMGLNGGLTMSMGYGLRSVYQRFLLRFERQEQALNQFGCEVPITNTDATVSKGSKDGSNTQDGNSREYDEGKLDSLLQCTFSGSSLSSLKDPGEVDENNLHSAEKVLFKCPISSGPI